MTPWLWLVPALALLPCGWFAAAWHYKRQLGVLHEQMEAVRRTATEHAQQARRQIGMLQAELAARPPLSVAERDRRAAAASAAAVRAPENVVVGPDIGFAATAILSDGFPQTVLMRPPTSQ
jgi:hypothetical protein